MKYLNKKSLSALGMAALALTMVLGLSACRSTPEEKAEFISERISDELELNDTQQTLLNTLKDKALLAGKTMKDNKKEMKSNLVTLISQPSIDHDQITLFMDSTMASMHTSVDDVIPSFIAFHASLSEEQKTQVINFIESHRKHHDH